MKKFIIGFVCGAALASSTAVMAADSIQAFLFPSQVVIRNDETIKPIDVTGENAVINYNNKAYIPLRTFAEAMGANVDFEEAAAHNGFKNQINIRTDTVLTSGLLTISDPDGYVNMGDMYVMMQPNGSNRLSSGTIRINKELKDKEIEITAFDTQGRKMGTTDFVHVNDTETRPPQPGETRPFTTSLDFDRKRNIGSYEVKIRNQLEVTKYEHISSHYGTGIVAALYPPSGFNGQLPGNQVSPFRVTFLNNTEHDIVLQPYDWQFKVDRIDEFSKSIGTVYEKTLPNIEGPLGRLSSYNFTVPWNPVDREGQPLGPGRYRVTLEKAESVNFTQDGGDVISERLVLNTRTPYSFNVEIQ